MCFWYGTKILRLVYKKVFFEILNGFCLIWPFILQNKVSLSLKRVEKNFFEIGRTGYHKKRHFALISKMCRSLEFGKREKKFYRKTEFLGAFWEKILGNFLMQEFYTFLKSA